MQKAKESGHHDPLAYDVDLETAGELAVAMISDIVDRKFGGLHDAATQNKNSPQGKLARVIVAAKKYKALVHATEYGVNLSVHADSSESSSLSTSVDQGAKQAHKSFIDSSSSTIQSVTSSSGAFGSSKSLDRVGSLEVE